MSEILHKSAFVSEYASFLSSFLHDDARALDVVFDCSNGSTGSVMQAFKRQVASCKLHGRWMLLNEMPDGNFPNHAPDPLHKGSLDALWRKVVSDHADIGIIFDADGDRMFVVDDRGRPVDSDAVAYLLLWSLRPKRFVSETKEGWTIKRHPIAAQRIESKTGHYFFKQVMRKWNAEFGHEESGHYYFKNFFFCDSGIMAAVEILNALAKLPYRLSEFVDLLPTTHVSAEINISVPFTLHDALLKRIEAVYDKAAVRSSKLDGITMEFADPDWWFNVRFSNTEQLARLRLEAADGRIYDAQLKKLTTLLKQGRK